MTTAQQASTETLFAQWRKGDAASGQAMAQRFTDWYFAISASRLGEVDGDGPFREACTVFSRGVGKVGDPRRLLGWAHGIARQQIHDAVRHGRRDDGDIPNAFTRRASPKDILVQLRDHLPREMGLLEHAYRGGDVPDPIAVLHARYAVKSWLAQNLQIPFRVLPGVPDPDRAPVSFYESGRMADEAEDTHFELFMLHDMEVCQDVAEFAHFAIALRGGLPGQPPPLHAPESSLPEPRARAGAPVFSAGPAGSPPGGAAPQGVPAAPPPTRQPAASGGNGLPLTLIYGVTAFAIVLVAFMMVLWLLLG
ncbi:MAG: hypothetical protein H6732_00300 [Alphaproteobacteria bacterium]|nr:hypothetical protein [Alphaproteobacteria bacterium]